MEPAKVSLDAVFAKYTRLPKDRTCLLLDVRPQKEFKRRHLLLSYCVRVSSNGKALVDYSNSSYDFRWSQECWWNTDVIVLGPAGLKKDSDVIQYLAKERRVASIGYFKDGIDAFEKAFPFLVGQSLKPHRDLVYPTPVHERKVFLGNWDSAANAERLGHLNISRLVTIHNEPKNLKFPNTMKQMAITAADLPSTNITPYFAATYAFIEEALAAGRCVLIHCGAGTSRSATIAAAYLMRKRRIGAHTAIQDLKSKRSSVCPNEGFWRQLCTFERQLSLASSQCSNPNKPPVVNESYGQVAVADVAANAAGERVDVHLTATTEADKSRQPSTRKREADSNSAEHSNGEAKRARSGASGLRAGLEVDVTKSGAKIGGLELPALRPHQRCTFGRGTDVDVKLEHASLSRRHAELAVSLDGLVTLTDLGSAHGTNVDGVWIKADQPKQIRVGTKFRFAASSRTYVVQKINLQHARPESDR